MIPQLTNYSEFLNSYSNTLAHVLTQLSNKKALYARELESANYEQNKPLVMILKAEIEGLETYANKLDELLHEVVRNVIEYK